MQTHVCYLDEGNLLVELGWNGQQKLFKGASTAQEYEAAPGSVITFAVTKDQLKVCHWGKGKGNGPRLWVAWVTFW
jgi:hypothetical protein